MQCLVFTDSEISHQFGRLENKIGSRSEGNSPSWWSNLQWIYIGSGDVLVPNGRHEIIQTSDDQGHYWSHIKLLPLGRNDLIPFRWHHIYLLRRISASWIFYQWYLNESNPTPLCRALMVYLLLAYVSFLTKSEIADVMIPFWCWHRNIPINFVNTIIADALAPCVTDH